VQPLAPEFSAHTIDIVSADTRDQADRLGHEAHSRAPTHRHLAQDARPTSDGDDLEIPTRESRQQGSRRWTWRARPTSEGSLD
jgi:hypothetical protein